MPLHIVIDVRRIRDFGIGTYIRNLTRALARLDQENRYTLIAAPPGSGTCSTGWGQFSDRASTPRRTRASLTMSSFRVYCGLIKSGFVSHSAEQCRLVDAAALRRHRSTT